MAAGRQSRSGWVLDHRAPLLTRTCGIRPRSSSTPLLEEGIRSGISAPLTVKGKILER
jgi:hypothetical protein